MPTESDKIALKAVTNLLPEEKLILDNALQGELPTVSEVLMVMGRLAVLRTLYGAKKDERS